MRRLTTVTVALGATLAALALAPCAPAASLASLIAPASACSGTGNVGAPEAEQEQAMLCMTNFARRHAGLGDLGNTRQLDLSAWHKSGDILRCDNFSHEACGRAFTYWMQRVGYIPESCWRAGENIAWGTGSLGTVHSIFTAWIHSPDHRENLLGPYRQTGISLRVGGLDGHPDAHVWTQEFGTRC